MNGYGDCGLRNLRWLLSLQRIRAQSLLYASRRYSSAAKEVRLDQYNLTSVHLKLLLELVYIECLFYSVIICVFSFMVVENFFFFNCNCFQMTVRDALNSALDEEMSADPKVFLMGEEVF